MVAAVPIRNAAVVAKSTFLKIDRAALAFSMETCRSAGEQGVIHGSELR